jgi:hypothetical protein
MLSLKNRALKYSDFKKSDSLVQTTHPNQTQTALFSFYERDGRHVQHYFLLSCDEILVLDLRFFQLRIQPLRQGQPSQIIASWFVEMFNFRSVLVSDCFKKNEVNLLRIIKDSIYRGLNLLEFAREIVPVKFDITMFTNSPCPPNTSDDDDGFRREINPLLSDIQLPRICVKNKRQLCIEDVAVEVPDEIKEEKDSKKRCS